MVIIDGMSPQIRNGGFRNAGNTCFVNAALQVVFSSPLVMHRLRIHNNNNNNNKCQGAVICAACAVVTDFDTLSAATSDVPENVLKLVNELMPQMESGSQQDSHEFLLNLLNAINNELAQDCIQKGKQVHYTVCQSCPSQRENRELFWGFEIPIRHTVEEGLSECFRAALVEVDCECKKKAPTRRFLKIVTMPEILIVQLGRFQFENDRSVRVKDVSVIPFRLDLTEYWDASSSKAAATFQCVGVVLHYGDSANEGHYRAAAVVEGGRWRLFDDRVVKPTSWATIQESDEVYFALYERSREGESPSPPPRGAIRRTYSALSKQHPQHPPASVGAIFSRRAFEPSTTYSPKTRDSFDCGLTMSLKTSTPKTRDAFDYGLTMSPNSISLATDTPARSASSSATGLPVRLPPLDGSFPSTARDGTPSSSSSMRKSQQLLASLKQASSSSSATTQKASQWRTPRALTSSRLDWSVQSVEGRSTLHGSLDFPNLPRASVETPSLLRSSTASAKVLVAPKWRTSPIASNWWPSPIATTAPQHTTTDLPSPDSPSSRWTTTPNKERLSWCRSDRPDMPGKVLTKYDTSSSDDDRLPSARFEASPPPRAFKCQSCGKTHSTAAALLRHEMRHSLWLVPDRRPYACRQCRRQFPSLEALHRHMRKHTSRSGLRCPKDCGVEFPDPGLLQRHLDAHGKPQFAEWKEGPIVEGRKEHRCKTCKGHFQNCETLLRHRKAYGEDRSRKPCRSCQSRSARRLKKLDYLTRIVPWQRLRDGITFP